MRHFTLIALCLFAFTQVGCTMFTRTIYVPDGKMIRTRRTVHNWPIWVKEKDGNVAEGRMDIPEGWYCAPKEESK